MDQVVDRLVERERNLMKMLEDRTPIVETYLQNVTLGRAARASPER